MNEGKSMTEQERAARRERCVLAALTGVIANTGIDHPHDVATKAVGLADALIAELDKG